VRNISGGARRGFCSASPHSAGTRGGRNARGASRQDPRPPRGSPSMCRTEPREPSCSTARALPLIFSKASRQRVCGMGYRCRVGAPLDQRKSQPQRGMTPQRSKAGRARRNSSHFTGLVSHREGASDAQIGARNTVGFNRAPLRRSRHRYFFACVGTAFRSKSDKARSAGFMRE